MWRLIRWHVHRWAFPNYDCKTCIGTPMPEYGCWCMAVGAVAPGKPPGLFRAWVQRRLEW